MIESCTVSALIKPTAASLLAACIAGTELIVPNQSLHARLAWKWVSNIYIFLEQEPLIFNSWSKAYKYLGK